MDVVLIQPLFDFIGRLCLVGGVMFVVLASMMMLARWATRWMGGWVDSWTGDE